MTPSNHCIVAFPERGVSVELPPGDWQLAWWEFPTTRIPVESPFLYRHPDDPPRTVRCNVRQVSARFIKPVSPPGGARR